jgi:hypothetical protein
MPSFDPIQTAVIALLNRIPDSWTEFDQDSLTDAEQKALVFLVAAGMVERRFQIRLGMLNSDVVVEVSCTATGENGLFEALEKLVAMMWQEWQREYEDWRQGDTPETSPFHCEQLKPNEWRLTEQGELARRDIAGGDETTPVDFVLKRGFFDGGPRLVNGKLVRREPVAGNGRLLRFAKVPADSPATGVRIGNWDEGAQAFAKAFQTLLDAPADARQALLEAAKPLDDGHDAEAVSGSDPGSQPHSVHKQPPWPGSNEWENWGIGLAADGTWHLYHFHRKNYRWVPHHHVTLAIPSGIADALARKFIRFGFIELKDAHDVLLKHAKGPVGTEIREAEVIRKTKAPMSRLRSVICQAVAAEGHKPNGRPISSPTRHTKNWQARVRFGKVERGEGGRLGFRTFY